MRPWPVCPGGWIRKSNGICVHLLLGLLLLLFLFLPLFRAWPAFVSYCWLPCLSLVAFVPFGFRSLFVAACLLDLCRLGPGRGKLGDRVVSAPTPRMAGEQPFDA
mgnify:CR=1 FL=1